MQQSQKAAASPVPAWMLDLLFAGTPTVTWAVAGSLPAGFDRAEQFAVLASGGGRSFLVPLGARRAAASALTSYNALRPGRKRAVRRALGLGLRTGLAQPLLRGKIDIGTARGATPDELAVGLLSEHLSRLLGQGPVAVAVGGGSGPYRKPVLQVFSVSGTPLGYVKVGWNDWTREAVRREAEALRACAGAQLRVGVPALLGHSTWQGLDLLVTAPLPRQVRRVGTAGSPPDARALREISALSPGYLGELATSPWWSGVRSRSAMVADPAARSALGRAAEGVERAHGGMPLRFGTWHGDLVPWNLARLGRRLYAWDWESSTPDAPLGFDAVHFHFQVEFVARGLPLGQAVPVAARHAAPALAELGLTAPGCGLLVVLHLIELFLRHEEARGSSGEADDRFYPAVIEVLDHELRRRASAPDTAGRAA